MKISEETSEKKSPFRGATKKFYPFWKYACNISILINFLGFYRFIELIFWVAMQWRYFNNGINMNFTNGLDLKIIRREKWRKGKWVRTVSIYRANYPKGWKKGCSWSRKQAGASLWRDLSHRPSLDITVSALFPAFLPHYPAASHHETHPRLRSQCDNP